MKPYASLRSKKRGFTLVELVTVIAVMGILAGIVTLGFGSWREQVAKKEIASDLSLFASSMKSNRNFSDGYPVLAPGTFFDVSAPLANKSIFLSSKNIDIKYVSGTDKDYCIEAKHKNISTTMFMRNTDSVPQYGTCTGGVVVPYMGN